MRLKTLDFIAQSLFVVGSMILFVGVSQKLEKQKTIQQTQQKETENEIVFNRWAIPVSTIYGLEVKSPMKKVRVAIVDTGVDWNHPMLAPFHKKVTDDAYQMGFGDPHGTHVAGIIAQHLTTAFGQEAYYYFTIESYRYEPGDMGSYQNALMKAVTSGADVLNLSVNGFAFSNEEAIMLAYAYEQGMDVVAAAGNNGVDFPTFPCAYPFVTCVENLDGAQLHKTSNRGDFIQAQAPGVNILSSMPHGEFGYMTGTSQSSPMVASAKAVERLNPKASAAFSWIHYKETYTPIFPIEGLLLRKPASK